MDKCRFDRQWKNLYTKNLIIMIKYLRMGQIGKKTMNENDKLVKTNDLTILFF